MNYVIGQDTSIHLEWIPPYFESVLYWLIIIGLGYAVFLIASRFSHSLDDDEPEEGAIDLDESAIECTDAENMPDKHDDTKHDDI